MSKTERIYKLAQWRIHRRILDLGLHHVLTREATWLAVRLREIRDNPVLHGRT